MLPCGHARIRNGRHAGMCACLLFDRESIYAAALMRDMTETRFNRLEAGDGKRAGSKGALREFDAG